MFISTCNPEKVCKIYSCIFEAIWYHNTILAGHSVDREFFCIMYSSYKKHKLQRAQLLAPDLEEVILHESTCQRSDIRTGRS